MTDDIAGIMSKAREAAEQLAFAAFEQDGEWLYPRSAVTRFERTAEELGVTPGKLWDLSGPVDVTSN